MIKKLNKYSYAQGTRTTELGSRNYDIAGYRLPSVTTILGKTKDNTFLRDWIKKKGKEEAEKIKQASATRGTSMHKYLENYVLGKGYEDLTDLGQETKRMAEKVIEVGLAPVSGYLRIRGHVILSWALCRPDRLSRHTQRQRNYY